jgi:hypothetical protein
MQPTCHYVPLQIVNNNHALTPIPCTVCKQLQKWNLENQNVLYWAERQPRYTKYSLRAEKRIQDHLFAHYVFIFLQHIQSMHQFCVWCICL